MLRTVTQMEIDDLMYQAKNHPRKRVIFRLHEHHEPVQRMINALALGTYIVPHKHENPDKVEMFSILKGKLAVLHFSEIGNVEDMVILDAHGTNRIVDIPPRVYHSIIVLEPAAALEIIQGPYNPLTHKRLAPWAPQEADSKAVDYRMYLTSIVENWR